jgi:hypothetical protein
MLNEISHHTVENTPGYLLNLVILRGRGEEGGDAKKVIVYRQALRIGGLIRNNRKRDAPGVPGMSCLKGYRSCARAPVNLIGQGPYDGASRVILVC